MIESVKNIASKKYLPRHDWVKILSELNALSSVICHPHPIHSPQSITCSTRLLPKE
jgi:hypothetical protein